MLVLSSNAPPSTAESASAGASTAHQERVVLRDGSMIIVRPLAAGDVGAIATWFDSLGPETRYARFLAPITGLSDQLRTRLAEVDHHNHEALTAVTVDGSTVGIARYIRQAEPGTAEVAVAVADQWRGRGIASLLLQRIAARARAADIHCMTALCLTSNTAILRLLRRLGPMTASEPDAGVVEVRIDIEQPSAAGGGTAPTARVT
jgi:RimJ/RimL family protein N-acetyltransferase